MQDPIQKTFNTAPAKIFRKKQILIYEGDPLSNIYYLAKGYVKVYNVLSSGAERVIFIYNPGDVFPMNSYLSRTASARYFYECLSDVEARLLPAERLAQYIKDNVQLGEALIKYTLDMNQLFLQRIDDLGVSGAKSKVVSLLSFLASRTSDTSVKRLTLDIPLRVQDVADMCGLTRETATIQLGELRDEGILDGHKKMTVDLIKLSKFSKIH
jgi:CRP/FNR family cyclic AMP-dependent transcriptional regulator